MATMNDEEKIKECQGCRWWSPKSYRIRCHLPKEPELDENGKCLDKEKSTWT